MGNILKDHISFIINTGDNSLEATGTQIVFNENDLTINVNGTDYFSFDDHNVSWTVMDEESVIHDYSEDYLTFTALEDTTFKFTQNALQYSLDDGSTWTTLAANTDSPTVNAGNKILWKQTGLTPTESNGIGTFSATGNFDVSGNIMSLYYGDNFIGQTDLTNKNYAFYNLFNGNTKLVNAVNLVLPATTLSQSCYQNMFCDCTSLINAPELPATALNYGCYNSMFRDCTSLITPPKLPATTLAQSCYSSMFWGCTSLTTAPALRAITSTAWCYSHMFYKCISLTSAPELPATTVKYGCYEGMFNGCTSLTAAPKLPATTLPGNCYRSMFQGCTSLTSAPELPATTLEMYCYYNMFQGCTSLTTAPEILPATTLADYCYLDMFNGCISLTNAPELPATTLAAECYQEMFRGCTSLTAAPELPATTLANSCYKQMFQGCINLNYINCFATDISASNCTTNWVNGVAKSGIFIKDASMESWTTGTSGIPTGWTVTSEPQINPTITISTQNYITVKSPKSKSYLGFNKLSSVHTLYISEDKQNWELITDVNKLYPINNEVYLCGKLTGNCSTLNYTQFKFISSNIQITGNCNSLWNYENINTALKPYCGYKMFQNCTSLTIASELPATTLANYCYYDMFRGCTSLTSAPELPATTLADYCYYQMFYSCTSLTTAPELPATTLANNCYYWMFYRCTSLTTAPELPATTLAAYCYYWMFYGCTSLATAPELPATTLADSCYTNMFNGCTSLTTAPELPATTLAQYCYYGMFYNCTSLTIAPELPATTLTQECYDSMFGGCTSLTVAPELPATTLASWCYANMFGGCISLTGAPELPATTLANNCYYNMFQNCTSLIVAPELPATTLADNCYMQMFYGCTNLNYIKCFATDINTTDCTTEWVKGVASSGIFIKADSMTSWVRGISGIPTNWNAYSVVAEDYFTLKTDSGSNGEFNIRKATNKSIDYSINGGITWTTTTATSTIVNASIVMLRSTDKKAWDNGDDEPGITCSINYHVEGNIMSLLYGDDFIGKINLSGLSNAFYDLFANSSTLTSANKLILPATILADSCYQQIFWDCTSLTIAPEILPATTLAEDCYHGMFFGCTSLVTAPELSATTLVDGCYYSMFQGCTSLTDAPELPATTLASNCYASMFEGCTSLITAPELPTTTLAQSCYQYMFYGCTNLNYIKCLATDISASNCTTNWVNGVASSGTFVKDASMESWTIGNNGIPSEWTIQDYDNSDVTLRIWIDDFPDRTEIAEEYGYDNWADYISNVISDITNNEDTWRANPYEYTGETFEWNDANYYLWQYNTDLIDEENYSSSVEYLLTDIIDYNELYERSLDYDTDNYGGIVCFLNSDLETYRGVDFSSGGGRAYPNETSDSIITIEQHKIARVLKIWIDDFSDVSIEEMYDNYASDIGGYKQYHLTQDTLTIDNITYYIWESNDEYDYDSNRAYILTTTNDYDELLSQSLSEDLNNDFTSFGGFLNEDSEESYIDDNMRIQYILDVEQNNNELYIYVDNIKLNGFDDGQTISDYINNPKTLGCNPYKLTSDTIDIDGESYYIWKRTDNIIDDNNVHYLLTTTNDNETLVNTSVESSKYNLAYKLNNCIYAFMGEDNEIYETPSKNVIVKVE